MPERRADFLGMSRVVRPGANHFLQRDDVGIEPRKHLDGALRHGAPVQAAAAMDVVGDDAERFTYASVPSKSRSKSRVGFEIGSSLLASALSSNQSRTAHRPCVRSVLND